jgi:hypothetical protein
MTVPIMISTHTHRVNQEFVAIFSTPSKAYYLLACVFPLPLLSLLSLFVRNRKNFIIYSKAPFLCNVEKRKPYDYSILISCL